MKVAPWPAEEGTDEEATCLIPQGDASVTVHVAGGAQGERPDGAKVVRPYGSRVVVQRSPSELRITVPPKGFGWHFMCECTWTCIMVLWCGVFAVAATMLMVSIIHEKQWIFLPLAIACLLITVFLVLLIVCCATTPILVLRYMEVLTIRRDTFSLVRDLRMGKGCLAQFIRWLHKEQWARVEGGTQRLLGARGWPATAHNRGQPEGLRMIELVEEGGIVHMLVQAPTNFAMDLLEGAEKELLVHVINCFLEELNGCQEDCSATPPAKILLATDDLQQQQQQQQQLRQERGRPTAK